MFLFYALSKKVNLTTQRFLPFYLYEIQSGRDKVAGIKKKFYLAIDKIQTMKILNYVYHFEISPSGLPHSQNVSEQDFKKSLF